VVVKRGEELVRLEPRWRSVYVRLQVLRALRLRRDRLPDRLGASCELLFVCHGNIIRSPMAEWMLRRRLPDFDLTELVVRSAGLRAAPGRGADPRARAIAPAFGVSLEAHVAQPVTAELVERATLIFVMDHANETELLARFPAADGKVLLLGAFARGSRSARYAIPDPYDGTELDIRGCYERLERAVTALAAGIATSAGRTPARATGVPEADALRDRGPA
jgi:protein-tyrosine phosphatase